jgi:hypothetical protein
MPDVLPWALVLVLLLARRKNRTGQAWLIFVPLLVVALVWRMPLRLIGAPADLQQMLGVLAMSLSGGWAAVWLLGDWIARQTWVIRQLIAIGILFLSAALSYASQFGLAAGAELAQVGILEGVCVLSLLAATGLSARSCRRAYRPGVFMAWLALFSGLAPAGLMLVVAFALAVAMASTGGGIGIIGIVIAQVVIGTVLFGGITFLVNLPFVILAFKSPFWHERFRDTFRLNRASADDFDGLRPQSPFAEPATTDPTAAPVGVDDVAGAWQFYLDEHSRTVAVDFKPDGTFSQTITTNWGEAAECPGGTWRLEGPMIHLSGYATVRQGTSVDRAWWMIDTPAGLAVFGGDDSKPDAFFRMTRVPTGADATR